MVSLAWHAWDHIGLYVAQELKLVWHLCSVVSTVASGPKFKMPSKVSQDKLSQRDLTEVPA